MFGWEVTAYDDSLTAASIIKSGAFLNGQPDLFLIDRQMPGLNGADLAKKFIRAYRPDTPIVMVTGIDLSESHVVDELAREGTITAWRRKPINIDELAQTVQSIITHH